MEKGLAEMESAIGLLPDELKSCLMKAREAIPALAAKEAPPIRFLRFHKYDSFAAARR